ncbi:MAG: sulfurtransferase [Spirochaetales bacterium]|nr:sulfurtransferase [Spirochaetales bacterium]
MKKFLFLKIALIMLLSTTASTVWATGAKEAPAASPAAEMKVNYAAEAVKNYYADLAAHTNYQIKEADFVEKVKAGEQMFVIDARSAADYAKGHVKGAVSVPWGMPVAEKLAYLPHEGNVYIYCYSGQTAAQAGMLMNAAGVPVKSVAFGWNFGISKVPGYEAITTTEATELNMSKKYDVNPVIAKKVTEYFERFASIKDTPFASNIISEANAKAIFDAKDKSAVFVSIRRAEDYAKGHIEGAINIPFASGMDSSFQSLPSDKKIIIYCYSGQTAGQTVAALRLLGYDAVSLKGGMGVPKNAPMGWTNQGYPVVAQ